MSLSPKVYSSGLNLHRDGGGQARGRRQARGHLTSAKALKTTIPMVAGSGMAVTLLKLPRPPLLKPKYGFVPTPGSTAISTLSPWSAASDARDGVTSSATPPGISKNACTSERDKVVSIKNTSGSVAGLNVFP